jgi:hypothetical protein
VPVWRFSDGELTAALLHAQSVLSQGYGRMLTLVSEADGRGLAAGKGYRDTATFLAGALRLSTREAKARVAHASIPLPLTGAALAGGSITVEHVTEIHRVLSRAPESLDAQSREYAERTLVELAEQAPPLSVRKAGDGCWPIGTPTRRSRRTPRAGWRSHGGGSGTGSPPMGRCTSPANSTRRPPPCSPGS